MRPFLMRKRLFQIRDILYNSALAGTLSGLDFAGNCNNTLFGSGDGGKNHEGHEEHEVGIRRTFHSFNNIIMKEGIQPFVL